MADIENKMAELIIDDNEKAKLHERQLKRQAVVEKHRLMLDFSIRGKGNKQQRWRIHFRQYVIEMATAIFKTEDQEYIRINKPDKLEYNDTYKMMKAYPKDDPMRNVFSDILTEFGCFDY